MVAATGRRHRRTRRIPEPHRPPSRKETATKPLMPSQPSTTIDNLAEHHHESELAPLLAAWDLAHPTLADPEWRHLLDELAHPRTTEAFHRLAAAA